MATGDNIIDEARSELNDEDGANFRWSDAELLRYVNASQRVIVTLRPEANIVSEEVSITGGTGIRQTLPSGGLKFVDVRNYDDGNAQMGPAIRRVELDAMNTLFPSWGYEQSDYPQTPGINSRFAGVGFDNYAHDPREPKVFYLFPAYPTGEDFDVYLTYSKLPTTLGTTGSTYGLANEYVDSAVAYVRYRALTKDGRYSVSPAKRQELYRLFLQTLGLWEAQEERISPENPRNAPPGGP